MDTGCISTLSSSRLFPRRKRDPVDRGPAAGANRAVKGAGQCEGTLGLARQAHENLVKLRWTFERAEGTRDWTVATRASAAGRGLGDATGGATKLPGRIIVVGAVALRRSVPCH